MRSAPRTATAARSAVIALLVFAVAGCTKIRHSEPERGANEQLLLATAVDHAIERVDFGFDPGKHVYLDGRYFDRIVQEPTARCCALHNPDSAFQDKKHSYR